MNNIKFIWMSNEQGQSGENGFLTRFIIVKTSQGAKNEK